MRFGIILLLALSIPATAAADLNGRGWAVEPTRFRVDPDVLEGQGSERGVLRSPKLSILFEGFRPIDMDTHEDETPAAGGGLRLSLDVPVAVQLSVGTYVAIGHRGFYLDWEYAHFGVIDVGGFARLRTAVRNVVFYLGAHGGFTRFKALEGVEADSGTWHAGSHVGIQAGRRRVGLDFQIGFNARRWSSGDLQWEETFDDVFVELYGSIGLYFLLGDYR